MEELKGAILVCHRIKEEKEEIENFKADKYWDVIKEEEKNGNYFLSIAKDMARFEKSIILEYFGIADIDGNLSVSIPRAIIAVIACIMVFSVCNCVMEGKWTLNNVLSGIQMMLVMIILDMVVGIPVFMVGRKNPEVLKKRNKIRTFCEHEPYYADMRERKLLMAKIGYVSKRIFDEGWKIGYMCRDEATRENDSGWAFMVGNEDEDYINDAQNIQVVSMYSLMQYDSAIAKYITMPAGTRLVRVSSDEFEQDCDGKEIFMEKISK